MRTVAEGYGTRMLTIHTYRHTIPAYVRTYNIHLQYVATNNSMLGSTLDACSRASAG